MTLVPPGCLGCLFRLSDRHPLPFRSDPLPTASRWQVGPAAGPRWPLSLVGGHRGRLDHLDNIEFRRALPLPTGSFQMWVITSKEETEYGEYRTKLVILEIYDEMQRAIDTGTPYQSRLDPPPADPSVAHSQ